jgi:hypothetical protein
LSLATKWGKVGYGNGRMMMSKRPKQTTAEYWLAKVNAFLPTPIEAGSREDEMAYDAYCDGKSARVTASKIVDYRVERDRAFVESAATADGLEWLFARGQA